ncbi:dTDP-4-dehydrorhamnose reductase [Hellea sp.]|nr:dTDP-4-dehydrorhamnose reductase [Hellea sp.]MDC1088164.1 dTDP-4-dehydrorhamnose reductase [Hellea sp.]
MKIAVIGGTGQLGLALKSVPVGADCTMSFYNREACDLSQEIHKTEKFIDGLQGFDVIIIAAAYTAVDAAETDKAVAHRVNGEAPAAIAKICAIHNICVVYISSDYVFNGNATSPYKPEQSKDPLNIYGMSKHAGEVGILASGAPAVILRTTWVFDGKGKNFMTTMLKLGKNHSQIKVIDDQVGRPTYAGDLAKACVRAAEKIHKNSACSGIYHVSGSGKPISWASFATAIFARAYPYFESPVHINRVESKEFPTIALRPKYSVLDVKSFELMFDMILPTWEEGLDKAIDEWKIKDI